MSRTIHSPQPAQTPPNGGKTADIPQTNLQPPLWLCDVTKQPVAADDCLSCSRNGQLPCVSPQRPPW